MPIVFPNRWILLFCCVAVFSNLTHAEENRESEGRPAASPSDLWDTTHQVGAWIWAENTFDRQTCRLWRSFEIPDSSELTSAHLRITADNSYRVFLDGREVGRGSIWESLTEYDLTQLLDPGPHILTVEAFSDFGEAGVILGLHMTLANEHVINLGSDHSWRVVPNSEYDWEKRAQADPSWPAARVLGPVGTPPWWRTANIHPVPPLQRMTGRFWQTGWFPIVLLSLCGITVFICIRLMVQLTAKSRAQLLLHDERDRIARDIHDDLGASLTKVVLLGEVAQSELPSGSPTREQIDQLCEQTRGALRSMNEIVWMVNSRRDTLQDFTGYVCKYVQAFLKSTPIRCRLDVDEVPDAIFELPVRRNLFLAVKEAVHNAVKYSEATELWLRIRRADEELLVMVEDNGKGFSPEADASARNGLSNMWQRAHETGGRCEVFTEVGAGCRVEFRIPLVLSRPQRLQGVKNFWARLKKAPASASSETSPSETTEPKNCEPIH